MQAARHARETFGDDAGKQLAETLRLVGEAANELGIDVGNEVRALLDAHAATFAGGTVSLHDEDGVPLRALGIGSTRLLIAGLQRRAATQSSILLVDELEHGLEPHRIIRFLGSLGAKEKDPPLQAFMTTHSPAALRELSGTQLFVLRNAGGQHAAIRVGADDDIQSAIRAYPDAFLASSVLVCEGASEVGLMRGLDQYLAAQGQPSISARGVALVDCGGGSADRPFERAQAFRKLGYRVAVLRDDDKKPTASVEKCFIDVGGSAFSWRQGRALEDELFASLTATAVRKMLDYAIELHGDSLVDNHVESATNGKVNLEEVQLELLFDTPAAETRVALGKAARTKKAGWFSRFRGWKRSLATLLALIWLMAGSMRVSRPFLSMFWPGPIMPDAEIDLLTIQRGTVTAPAGCGKTHLVAEALRRHDAAKPILILTHTNAGVAALRGRLDKAGVPPRAYRLATIDGWAMRPHRHISNAERIRPRASEASRPWANLHVNPRSGLEAT